MTTLLRPAQQAYAMLGSGDIWDTAQGCEQVLSEKGLPHAIVGGVAVCLHGYQRSTVDVDILVRQADSAVVKAALEDAGFRWDADAHEFHSESGVPVQFLLSGEPAGYGIPLPDPADEGVTTVIEKLTVVSLARLIEIKIACGLDNPRRTHRDLADVVELIAAHNLSRSFAKFLHKSVRKEFRELVLRARGEA